MILRSIEISGWRCFLESVAVGPFSDQLNVIYGPNGTGKTSLFEALRSALMDNHFVTGQEINEIRPWGRALSPKVVVSFQHQGTEYRVNKQFLDGGFSILARKENGDYRPLAEGRQADEMIRGLFSKNSPGKGLSQCKHWGVAQVLWAPQGQLRLSDLSEDLIDNIHTTLGLQLSDQAAGPIEERVGERFLQFYTPQGKIKTGKGAPPLIELQDVLSKAKERKTSASEALQRSEDASRKVEGLGSHLKQKNIEAGDLSKSVDKAREQADQFRALKSAEGAKRSDFEKIAAQYAQLNGRIGIIHDAESELDELKTTLIKLESELPVLERESEGMDKLRLEAEAKLDAARKGEEVVALAEKEAEEARDYFNGLLACDELGKRLRKIETAERSLAGLTKERSTLVAPDGRSIKTLRKLYQERDEAKLLMDTALLSLEIVPEIKGRLDVVKGEEPGSMQLAAGASTIIKGSPEIVAIIKGIAKMRISGPPGAVDTFRRTFREKQGKIEEATRPYGTADLEALEGLTEKGTQLDKQIGEAQKELDVLCGGDEKASLINERARTVAITDNIERERPDWKANPPDPEALRRRFLNLKRENILAVRDANQEWEDAVKVASKARERAAASVLRTEDGQKSIKKAEKRLADATNDGKTKEVRGKELQLLLLDRDATNEALNEIRKKLDEFVGNPAEVLAKLEKSLDATRADTQKIRDEERTAVGNLEILISGGPYSLLASAEEEISRLEEAIRRETVEMDSIRMLHETLADCRLTILAAYARPVEEAATRLMHRIAGRRTGKIEIGDLLKLLGVSPESAESIVAVENLSGGEQEQLYFATRLALAEVLAKDERQMVVLDDVLTATDTPRFARILTILEEAVDKLQILILTCHPERYRALEAAQFFDLEALTSQRAG
ncbi:MAG: AAA family ATPase [Deltaproteobacteria bacterium]|nr:AAA family ATPase [Deltaproteobacteria bacterium]